MKRNRKESYIKVTRNSHEIELKDIPEQTEGNEIKNKELTFYINDEKVHEKMMPTLERIDEHKQFHNSVSHMTTLGDVGDEATPCSSEQGSSIPSVIVFTFKKNLIVLCAGFILIFSAFRGIQNLQSSINSSSHLGIITMMCVYGSMFLTCIFAPIVINVFTAKWALSIGMLCFLIWFGANFYPRFYTLIPTALLAGFGQGILWSAEISYILKLAFDSARVTKDQLDHEMFRFHGIFLACFQTTHIWGNLISSVLLSQKTEIPPANYSNVNYIYDMDTAVGESVGSTGQCGALSPCDQRSSPPLLFTTEYAGPSDVSQVLWKLMCAYIVLGFLGFCLILLILDRIGARSDPEKTGYQVTSTSNVSIYVIVTSK
ncbi:protein unc-93 homolog A [Patella vulgata]|uniref:protein unc-93 homolog A n=1 Tax=Patella vulgata TaxID=6465 RepID=UPI0024A96D28|nr:protein unc-93 homolog A [Patella vulgata]